MVCRAGLIAVAMVLAATTGAIAQGPPPFQGFAGTPEDQKACQPAVFRYCRAALADTNRNLASRQQNRTRSGRPCQTVLENNGQ